MNIQIKSRYGGRLLYECEAESMLSALQKAVMAGEKQGRRWAAKIPREEQ
jgi:hypothetical protein